MIKIMNLRYNRPIKSYDIYIDRRSPLGNIFYMSNEAQRDTVCNQYQKWFDTSVLVDKQVFSYTELIRLQSIYNKYGKLNLFCWCTPKRCHGETIKKWLKEPYE